MGRLGIKRKKDWKAKFRKSQPDPAPSEALGLRLVSPFEMAKEKLDERLSDPKHEHLNLQERNNHLLDAAILGVTLRQL